MEMLKEINWEYNEKSNELEASYRVSAKVAAKLQMLQETMDGDRFNYNGETPYALFGIEQNERGQWIATFNQECGDWHESEAERDEWFWTMILSDLATVEHPVASRGWISSHAN